jgi:ethanolamine utilization protein EutN
MYFGRVVGCVWCTVKNRNLDGQRLLVVQPLTPSLENTGKRIVCTDATGAGTGELVYWVRGKEASFPFLPQEPPTDTTIVGIVDSVHLKSAARPDGGSERSRPMAEVAGQPSEGKRARKNARKS